MLKHLKVFILAMLLLTVNLQCDKTTLCKVLGICDLASNIITPLGIDLGVPIAIFNEVLNLVDQAADCTEDADPSESDFDVEYRVNANSPWQIIQSASNKVIQVGAITAGAKEKDELTYLFNQAGQYRFHTNADYNYKVEERNEGNNTYTGGKGVHPNGNNFAVSEVITVYPNPAIPYDPSKPQVELLSIRKVK